MFDFKVRVTTNHTKYHVLRKFPHLFFLIGVEPNFQQHFSHMAGIILTGGQSQSAQGEPHTMGQVLLTKLIMCHVSGTNPILYGTKSHRTGNKLQ